MVRKFGKYSGLTFDEDVYPYLTASYGGHPFLIRLACSVIWRRFNKIDKERKTHISQSLFRSAIPEIRERLAQPIKDILLSLVWWYPEEYDLLTILASGDVAFVKSFLASNNESVVKIAAYGLLDADRSNFTISDMRDFLNQNGEEYKKALSPFIRKDIPLEILPEVPDIASLGRLFEMKSQLEISLRRAIILYLKIENGFDDAKVAKAMISGLKSRQDRKQPSEIFIGRTPNDVVTDLYVLDLRDIILSNWQMFSALFENNKTRFQMNMDTVNNARRKDSHVKPLTRLELEEFENSYGWLLNCGSQDSRLQLASRLPSYAASKIPPFSFSWT